MEELINYLLQFGQLNPEQFDSVRSKAKVIELKNHPVNPHNYQTKLIDKNDTTLIK